MSQASGSVRKIKCFANRFCGVGKSGDSAKQDDLIKQKELDDAFNKMMKERQSQDIKFGPSVKISFSEIEDVHSIVRQGNR